MGDADAPGGAFLVLQLHDELIYEVCAALQCAAAGLLSAFASQLSGVSCSWGKHFVRSKRSDETKFQADGKSQCR